jgi:hypothetical protein
VDKIQIFTDSSDLERRLLLKVTWRPSAFPAAVKNSHFGDTGLIPDLSLDIQGEEKANCLFGIPHTRCKTWSVLQISVRSSQDRLVSRPDAFEGWGLDTLALNPSNFVAILGMGRWES